MTPLHVTLTLDRHGAPLAVVDLPGGGAELCPSQLRDLAAALLRIADDAEARRLTHRGRPLPAVRRVYGSAPS